MSAQFLCVLLSEEAKKRGTSGEKSASLIAALNSESGEKLCELLLEVKLSRSLKMYSRNFSAVQVNDSGLAVITDIAI